MRCGRRGKVVKNLRDLLVPQGLDQLLLIRKAQVFEYLGSDLPWQDSEEYGFLVGWRSVKISAMSGGAKSHRISRSWVKLRF